MDFGARDEEISQELTEGGAFWTRPWFLCEFWFFERGVEERECSYFFGELCRIIDFYDGNEYIFIGQRFSDQ